MSRYGEYAGREIQGSRLGVSGTQPVDDVFDPDQKIAVIAVGPVDKVEFGTHQGDFVQKHRVSGDEIYVVSEEDIQDVLTAARKAAKARRDAEAGQSSLDDDIDADDEGSLSAAVQGDE